MELKNYLQQTIGIFNKSKEAAKKLSFKSVDIELFSAIFFSNFNLGCATIVGDSDLMKELSKTSFLNLERKKQYKDYDKEIKFTPKLKKFLAHCEDISFNIFNLDYVAPEVIFLGFLDYNFSTPAIKSFFFEGGLHNDTAEDLIYRTTAYLKDEDTELFSPKPFLEDMELQEQPEQLQVLDMFNDNDVLSQFAENLNIKAVSGDFDAVIDFDGKIEELATILCRKKKPNAILVGPAGCGKTSVVEGLASSIVNGKAPELLSNKVIYSLSLSSMVAGTQYRGQFEERLENFVNEMKKYDNLILFIDEIHTLVGAGGSQENSLEASNILKPELARGTISCIGATTINEYTQTIKKDSALDRRFERVTIREPSKFQMNKILPSLVEFYEEFHNVKYSKSFLSNVIEYCERFMPNKCYPDKAVDVIDHCGAQAKVEFWSMDGDIKTLKNQIIQEDGDSTEDLFAEFESKFSDWVADKQKEPAQVTLKQLKSFFDKKENPLNKKHVIESFFDHARSNFVGNRKQIKKLEKSIKLSNLGFENSSGGIPIFCLNGFKHSGKTMFTKLLQESLQMSGATVLSYNGVHFSDHYANYKIVPQIHNNTSLCEKVLIEPNCVIIIDDFHKMNESTHSLFTEIFKEGKIYMNSGDVADFSNCKFFITGDTLEEKSMGFAGGQSPPKSKIRLHLSKYFSSNIFLEELTERDLRRVLWSKLKNMSDILSMNNIKLIYDFKFIKNFVQGVDFKNNALQSLNDEFDQKIKQAVAKESLSGESEIDLKKLSTKKLK